MKNSLRIAFVSMIITMIVSSCTLPGGLSGLITETSTNLPYFMDDFSDHSNGWKLVMDNTGIIQYDDDSLRMVVKSAGLELRSSPGLRIDNSSINVDAQMMGGPENNSYGIICRYKDKGYYAFLISSDGYYAITKTMNGTSQILSSDSFEPSQYIVKGMQNNHIRADCNGPMLTLYVNWQKLAEVGDLDLTSGDVGLIAGSPSEPGTDIKFDNFIVMKTD